MVHKSGVHQLRLVVYPIILQGFVHLRWCNISSINSIGAFMGLSFDILLRYCGLGYILRYDVLSQKISSSSSAGRVTVKVAAAVVVVALVFVIAIILYNHCYHYYCYCYFY